MTRMVVPWHDTTLGMSGLLFFRFSLVIIWSGFFLSRSVGRWSWGCAGGSVVLRLGPVCLTWRGR